MLIMGVLLANWLKPDMICGVLAGASSASAASPEAGEALVAVGDDIASPVRYLSERKAVHGDKFVRVLFWNAVYIFVSSAIMMFVSKLYHYKVTDRRDPFPTVIEEDLALVSKDPLSACLDDRQYCLYGWFCGCVRLADTFAAADVTGYWAVILVILVTHMFWRLFFLAFYCSLHSYLNAFVIAGFTANIFLAAYLATLRARLRQKLEEEPDSFCQDVLSYFWCFPCMAIYDAQRVDGVTRTKVHCFFNLIKMEPAGPPNTIVGNSVLVTNAAGPPNTIVGTPVLVANAANLKWQQTNSL